MYPTLCIYRFFKIFLLTIVWGGLLHGGLPTCAAQGSRPSPIVLRYQQSPTDTAASSALFDYGLRQFYNRNVDSLAAVGKAFEAAVKRTQPPTRTLAQAHAAFFQCMYHLAKSEFTKAQPFVQRALSGYESMGAYEYAFSGYTAYAVIFNGIKNDSMVHQYYHKARYAAVRIGDSARMAKSWNNLAQWFVERKPRTAQQQDSAAHYYQQALKYTLRHGSSISKIQLLNNVANFYVSQKDFPTALGYSRKAVALLDGRSTTEARVATSLTLAQIYVRNHQEREALAITDTLLPLLRRDSLMLKFLKSAYSVRIRSFRQASIPDSAYESYEAYVKISEQMAKADSRKEFNELAVKYEVAKKEHENLRLQHAAQQQRLIFLVVLMLLMVATGIVGFFWYRGKAQARLAEEHRALEETRRIAAENELQYAGQLLVNKNKTLLQLRGLLAENHHANATALRADIARMIEGIEKDIKTDGANDAMLSQTAQSDDVFIHKLQEQFPALTKNDLRLCSYIKLGFSSAEIATFLNITEQSVEVRRSRVRAKLNVPEKTKFTDFLDTII